MADTKKRRRWFSFSLRALLLALTAFGVGLGWWANSAQRQRAAVATLEALSERWGSPIDVRYDYNGYDLVDANNMPAHAHPPRPTYAVPRPILNFLGVDYFHDVTSVTISSGGLPANQALRQIAHFRRLHFLRIEADGSLANDGVAQLAPLRELKSLSVLNAASFTEDSFRTIGRLSKLRSLYLGNAPLTDEGLTQLAKLRLLQRLTLGGLSPDPAAITEKGFAELSRLTNLEVLRLGFIQGEQAGFQRLSALKGLKQLQIVSSNIRDEDLQFVGELKNLEELHLTGSQLDGSGFREASNFLKLQTIDLSESAVNDAAIPYLARLPNLREISLKKTPVTAKGLEQFQACPTLRRLYVDRFVEASLKRLREVLPNCKVEY